MVQTARLVYAGMTTIAIYLLIDGFLWLSASRMPFGDDLVAAYMPEGSVALWILEVFVAIVLIAVAPPVSRFLAGRFEGDLPSSNDDATRVDDPSEEKID